MKKTIVILIAGCSILFGNDLFAQQAGDVKKGWASSDRQLFITDCIATAVNSMSRDSARFYCYCMQEKLEKKYPDIERANKLSADDLETPEWQNAARDCITGISSWSSADRSEFMSECVNSGKESIGEAKAKKYCECMLFKIEQRYPDPANADDLDEEKLATPEWKKIIQSCLDF
jgi:hypothetical protein